MDMYHFHLTVLWDKITILHFSTYAHLCYRTYIRSMFRLKYLCFIKAVWDLPIIQNGVKL